MSVRILLGGQQQVTTTPPAIRAVALIGHHTVAKEGALVASARTNCM